MDFQKRLAKAVERGQKVGAERARAEAQKALSEKELRRLHGQYRLEVCEHIENCLRNLPQHFPGFEFQALVDERGWGAVVSRDDLEFDRRKKRSSSFSRLEIVVRPLGEFHLLELAAKATIRNKEAFNRTHFQRLEELDLAALTDVIDLWVLEYAEMFAAER